MTKEEKEALQHRLAMYEQLVQMYPLEHKHLQRVIEVLMLLERNDEAELLLDKLQQMLMRQGLNEDAEKAQHIRMHLNHEKHCKQLYSTPFLHLASSNFLEKAFRKHRRIELEEGDYLIRYGVYDTQMFIVVQGELAVWSRDEHGEKYFEHVMQAGEIIGELAFLDDAPRTADVIACKPTTVLAIPSKAALKLFMENPEIEQALRAEATARKIQMDMKKNAALNKLPKHVQHILAKAGRYAHYKTLERIYQSEQAITTIDLICDGFVQLVGDLHDGSSLILNSLKKGSLIGCAATMPHMSKHYTADIVSMSGATLIQFPIDLFQKVMDANPRLYQAVLQYAEEEQASLLQTISQKKPASPQK
jgi:CRP-like cAMP-binding protein